MVNNPDLTILKLRFSIARVRLISLIVLIILIIETALGIKKRGSSSDMVEVRSHPISERDVEALAVCEYIES